MTTQNATEKTHFMFTLSAGLRAAIGQYAQDRDMSEAAVIRAAVASKIGYDLKNEPISERRGKKYANEFERKEAQKERQKAKRDLVKKLMAMARSGETAAAIAALEASLRGIEDEDDETDDEAIAKQASRVANGETA